MRKIIFYIDVESSIIITNSPVILQI